MDLESPTPAPRNELGKLPYDVKLRASAEKKKPQSFSEAAADLFGCPSGQRLTSSKRNAGRRDGNDRRGPAADKSSGQKPGEGEKPADKAPREGGEPTDKARQDVAAGKEKVPTNIPTQEEKRSVNESPRKRKSHDTSQPDLNAPAHERGLVPTGLVYDRLTQLGNLSGRAEEKREVQEKQRVSSNQSARSAAAAGGSPRQAQ